MVKEQKTTSEYAAFRTVRYTKKKNKKLEIWIRVRTDFTAQGIAGLLTLWCFYKNPNGETVRAGIKIKKCYRKTKKVRLELDDSTSSCNYYICNFDKSENFYFSDSSFDDPIKKRDPDVYSSFYEKRCPCTEKALIKKKIRPKKRKQDKSVIYADSNELKAQTFQLKYENLSPITKLLLNSFQKKYLYYAIDDILNLFKSDPIEQRKVLSILYSPVLSLQNNQSINFFDIWIDKVYISREKKINKFLSPKDSSFGSASYITIKFLYKTKTLVKKQELLW